MLFDDTYKTVQGRSEGIYKDRGSKFIAIVYPVRSETDVKEKLSAIKSEYHDARHHCYAYMLGADKSAYRINDDGEPSGTAGRPILGQINSHDLTNLLVVVVRYFGGTKLGVRGLINAYKSSAHEAISSAKIITKTVDEVYEIEFDYASMNPVMQILKDPEVNILSQDSDLRCRMKFSIRRSLADQVCNQLKKIDRLDLKFYQ